nr:MAG TPA: hypothetical protein [Caudoviricetes sp.]
MRIPVISPDAAIERKRNRQNPRQGKRICETGTTNSHPV